MIRRAKLVVALALIALVASSVRAEDQYFDSDGVKIHYVVEGEGPPVLLIHGFTASIQMQWGAPGVIRDLAKDFQVIAIDNRGHGRSGKPHDPADYGLNMVEDALRLLDHLKIEKAHVVGYSMGGFITTKLITTKPERVISAVIGGAGWSREGDERMAFIDELATSLDEGKGITPLIMRLNPPDRPAPSEDQLKLMNQMILAMNDPKALAACIRGMRQLVVTEEQLRANKIPALALIGADDPLKAGVDEMEQVMSDLEVVVIENSDHMTAFNRAQFRDGLHNFLIEHSPTLAAKAEPAAAN